jgi:hypothetical protein
MFKWIGKIRLWKREKVPEGYTLHEFGRYVYKPVIARAMSVVIGVSQAELCSWIANPEIEVFLNGELIQGTQWAMRRLESGGYEIKIPSQNKIWKFHIE